MSSSNQLSPPEVVAKPPDRRTVGYVRDVEPWLTNIRKRYQLYLLALPGFLFLILFRLIPTLGSVIAWQDYNILAGLQNSPWVGWRNFQEMFQYNFFWRIFRNSLIIGLQRVLFSFPIPIILALLLNEVRNKGYQRTIQTLAYFPHFLSWVIVSQIFLNLLHPDGGLVNVIRESVFGLEPEFFMVQRQYFRPVVVISYIWRQSGFDSIIYMAALTAIDPQLYEAASIDGATRWKQLWYITLPSLLPTIIVLFLINIGRFLEIGFDQIWTLSNPVVWSVADIFDTYVYRVGLLEGGYSITTAVNLFKSALSFVLLFGANAIAKKTTDTGIF
ncbi:MAG: ABC transporter permease [Spirochaetota bacterium]